MLHSLTQVSNFNRKVGELLTQPENQNSPELMTMQAVINKLVNNSCSFVSGVLLVQVDIHAFAQKLVQGELVYR